MPRAFTFRPIVPRHGFGASIAITRSIYKSTLTVVPFTVTSPNTVTVSGGGNAINAAAAGAAPGTRLLVTDSLTYSTVTVTGVTDLTIEADAGQTPVISAPVGNLQHALSIGSTVSGLRLKGLTFEGNGNATTGLFADMLQQGIVHCGPSATGVNRIIVESCTFTENTDPTASAPGIQFAGVNGGQILNVSIRRCSFYNVGSSIAAASGGNEYWGACTVTGVANCYIQNSKFVRVPPLTSGSSRMKGVCVKNVQSIVEDVLCDDLTSAFGPFSSFHALGTGLYGTAVGPTTLRNCVSYNPLSSIRAGLFGQGFNVFNCTALVVTPGRLQTGILSNNAVFTMRDSVFAGAGDEQCFESGPPFTETYNDIYNVGTVGKVLDATDFTIDPLITNAANRVFVATAPALQTGGFGGGQIGVKYNGVDPIFWVGDASGILRQPGLTWPKVISPFES